MLTPEQRQAFLALKRKLCDAVELATPNFEREFCIFTDASDGAVAGVLSQFDPLTQSYKPLAFCSKKLTDVQKRWPIAEREAYVTIHALLTWEHIVLGYKITLFTDSSPCSICKARLRSLPSS